MNHRPLAVFSLFALLANFGCTPSSPSIGVALGSEFTLKPGETARIDSTDLGVFFFGVLSDSRCPANAICVQAGDAVVALRVGTAEVELRSNTVPERTVGIYKVRVVKLEPYPFSTQPIPPADYRASLVVTRP
jgi:hypothetical protein